MGGTDATASRYQRQDATVGHFQARRYLPANSADRGCQSVVARSKKTYWIEKLLERHHFNAVVVALANKMAQTVWAVLAKGKAFDLFMWNPLEQANA